MPTRTQWYQTSIRKKATSCYQRVLFSHISRLAPFSFFGEVWSVNPRGGVIREPRHVKKTCFLRLWPLNQLEALHKVHGAVMLVLAGSWINKLTPLEMQWVSLRLANEPRFRAASGGRWLGSYVSSVGPRTLTDSIPGRYSSLIGKSRQQISTAALTRIAIIDRMIAGSHVQLRLVWMHRGTTVIRRGFCNKQHSQSPAHKYTQAVNLRSPMPGRTNTTGQTGYLPGVWNPENPSPGLAEGKRPISEHFTNAFFIDLSCEGRGPIV